MICLLSSCYLPTRSPAKESAGQRLSVDGFRELIVHSFGMYPAAGTCWGLYILVGAALGRHTTQGNGLALGMAIARR